MHLITRRVDISDSRSGDSWMCTLGATYNISFSVDRLDMCRRFTGSLSLSPLLNFNPHKEAVQNLVKVWLP